MLENEKADLLCHRHDANVAKKRKLYVFDIGRGNGSRLNEGEGSKYITRNSLGCVFSGGPSRHGNGKDYG